MKKDRTFFEQIFYDENPRFSVVLEDDGRVAYAYLLKGDDIVSDVWLYNRSPTAIEINSPGNQKMPFLNSSKYSLEKRVTMLAESSRARVDFWGDENDPWALVSFFDEEFEVLLKKGALPGWSNNVKLDGPLTQILTDERIDQISEGKTTRVFSEKE